MEANTGGELDSVTTTTKESVTLMGGTPLSVTRTVSVLVEGPWSGSGVQLKTPLDESMVAPAGAPGSRLKARVWAGRSESVARTVKVSRVCLRTVWLPMGAM